MGNDLGGRPGDVFILSAFGKVTCPGEKGGVAVTGLGKCAARADSIRGVDCDDSRSFASVDVNLESRSFIVSSTLLKYLLLLGVDLFMVLRHASPLSFDGRTRSDGFMLLISSVQLAVALAGVSPELSVARTLPLLLSLRRSRIPLALRFLTAGLRNRAPYGESR